MISDRKISIDTNGPPPDSLDKRYNFGESVEFIGDLNGDGFEDLAVGAPGHEDLIAGKTKKGLGAVFILFLDANQNLLNYKRIGRDIAGFTAPLGQKYFFGTGLANLGDVDGDGINDLAVGCSGDDDVPLGKKTKEAGAVYILFMDSDGTVKSHVRLSNTNLSLALAKKSKFGADIAAIDDLSGNGVNELLVGSPGHAPIDPTSGNKQLEAGAAYVLFLNSSGMPDSTALITLNGTTITGLLKKDKFGSAVTTLGDIDADDIPDVAIGAPLHDTPSKDGGSVYIVNLNAKGTAKSSAQITPAAGLDQKDAFGTGLGTIEGPCYSIVAAAAIGDDDADNGKDKDKGAIWLSYSSGSAVSSAKWSSPVFADLQELTVDSELGSVVENETSALNYKLYPNPNKGHFKIEMSSSSFQQFKMQIFSVGGNEVFLMNADLTDGQFSETFDLTNLKPGMYLVRLSSGDFVESHRMVLLR